MKLAFGSKSSTQQTAEARSRYEGEIALGCRLLEDTFPDDPRVDHVHRRVSEFSEHNTLAALALARAYVRWACSHPDWINSDPPIMSCVCPDAMGWVDTDDGKVRPCLRCNRDLYDSLMAQEEVRQYRASVEEDC